MLTIKHKVNRPLDVEATPKSIRPALSFSGYASFLFKGALSCLSVYLVWATGTLNVPAPLDSLARTLHAVFNLLSLPVQLIASLYWPSSWHVPVGKAQIVSAAISPWLWVPLLRWLLQMNAGRRDAVPPTSSACTMDDTRRSLPKVEPVLRPKMRSTRRGFLSQTGTLLVGVGGGLALDATIVEPSAIVVRQYRMKIPGLPAALDGIRLGHLSDTHYGPFISLTHIRRAIRKLHEQRVDFVCLTGDYVHRTSLAIHDGIGVLEECQAPLGAAAVLGNHDHYEGAGWCRERLKQIGIPALDHGRAFLTKRGLVQRDVPPADCLVLAGLGDLWQDPGSFAPVLFDLDEALPRLVLAHNPDTAERSDAGRFRVDGMLSGHTHGGQVWVPGFGTPILPSSYGQKYSGGYCQGPSFPVIVSRGVGMGTLPVRFQVPAEVGVIELVSG